MQSITIVRGDPQSEADRRWSVDSVESLLGLPMNDLLLMAHETHRAHHDPNAVQLSTLLSIKTGGCPEDCGYCPQAARYHTEVVSEEILPLDAVVAAATAARVAGASRFCMGAAWRGPKDRDLEPVLAMVREVKALGLETCATLGMLKAGQAERLFEAGLDYYNHNLDTSPEFYGKVITTRDYRDRLDTLDRVRAAGMHVCCGGIVGMGESRKGRAGLIAQLANLDPYPESVPINSLVQVEGTPLHAQFGGVAAIDPIEFVRTIAAARITMPKAMVRLSAGRRELGDAAQVLCYFAGANSVFYGDKLLTTGNPDFDADRGLFARLGINAGLSGQLSTQLSTQPSTDLGAGNGAGIDTRDDVADVA
jgi:biotin synthase